MTEQMLQMEIQKAEELIACIGARMHVLDKRSMHESRLHWNSIAKPLYGLGQLEELIVQIAGIQGTSDVHIEQRAVAVMCADNGIIAEGVTQSGYEVTTVVSKNIANGLASVNHMAQCANADVFPTDVGMKEQTEEDNLPIRKLMCGTNNFLVQPAMTQEALMEAIQAGIDRVRELKEKGYQIIVTGEMGIGNTTTSSALTSVLLGVEPKLVTGRGAGLDDDRLINKIKVIEQAVKKYQLTRDETLRTLLCVGGLDLCGLVGVFFGGAMYDVPIVIDGVITAAAALTAARLLPAVKPYMIASHVGKEPAMQLIMKELGTEPVIQANLALGEGTGGVMLLPMLDMALSVYRENATFEELSIEEYEEFGKS